MLHTVFAYQLSCGFITDPTQHLAKFLQRYYIWIYRKSLLKLFSIHSDISLIIPSMAEKNHYSVFNYWAKQSLNPPLPSHCPPKLFFGGQKWMFQKVVEAQHI